MTDEILHWKGQVHPLYGRLAYYRRAHKAGLPSGVKFQYSRSMDAFDVFIPEIVQSATEWVEDRYGRFAGWLTFIVFLVGVPLAGLTLVIAFVALQND